MMNSTPISPIRHPFLKVISIVLCLLYTLSSHADPLWVDVRSAKEHKVDNISGHIRISHYDIVERITKRYPNKTTPINLYCHSGGRAETAKIALQQAGYTHVNNIGSVSKARQLQATTN